MRCLLFSSDEESVQPILQALAALEIEGEYCASAANAVERVATQMFSIVIANWEDQPEASLLLKTARDLKAAQRPLTLAIATDGKLPEALRAGANSVLLKPLRVEQVRDTLKTACELLRAKAQPSKAVAPSKPAVSSALRPAPGKSTMAARASAVPSSVTKAPELHPGEFLVSSSPAPGVEFDTESEVQKALEAVPADEVDALTDLEPTAAAVGNKAVGEKLAQPPAPVPAQPSNVVTGWAALQARLGKSDLQSAVTHTGSQNQNRQKQSFQKQNFQDQSFPDKDWQEKDSQKKDSHKTDLLSYDETPSYGKPQVSTTPSASIGQEGTIGRERAIENERVTDKPKAVAVVAEEAVEPAEPGPTPASQRGRIFLLAVAAALAVIAAVPQGRRGGAKLYHTSARALTNWLNPPPVKLPQTVAGHDSLGQLGDEYKLPSVPNIPDASTDPSQIRVLPVVDPTAKPEKNADANNPQPAVANDNNPALNGQNANQGPGNNQTQNAAAPASSINVSGATPVSPSSNLQNSNAQAPNVQSSNIQIPNAPAAAPSPVRPVALPARNYSPPSASATGSAGIPSSLKTQVATSTPDASGAMPPEAAMASIEPVSLPESAVRALLAEAPDPEYPASAKASAQHGSVVLQVLIARDGTVQDAKFLQGSLLFARAAIDAVKQWRFKPYSLNGRAVSVQSTVTLSFKPPA